MEEVKKEQVEYINNKCPNCGSDLAFFAGTKKLKCESCGSLFDIDSSETGTLDDKEKDYISALKKIDALSRFEVNKYIHCKDCGATFNIKDKTVSTKCPYCGSFKTAIEEKDNVLSIDGVIPFVVTKEQVSGIFFNWIKKRAFAPVAMKRQKTTDFEGYYIPFFTFDSDTKSSYSAQRGDYYYVTRTIHIKEGTRTVRERKVRWTYVSGNYDRFFNDLIIRATNNNFNKFVEKIKTFNLNYMEAYQEKYLLGYYAERASITLENGFIDAKITMDSIIDSCIRSKIGGDEISNLRIHTTYDDVTYKNIMAPIYCGTFEFKDKTYRFLVNGQTGKFTGTYPKSALKITFLVLGIIAVIALIVILALMSS